MALRANVAANFIGQGWRALMALAFVPIYIRLLGIEAFGLIGLFATLQLCLGLLDLGMRPVLTREAARYTGGAHDDAGFWTILRSLEWIAAGMALLAALLVAALSPWLATHWVNPQTLTTAEVAQAFMLMGLVAALQMVESLYASALAGLQRQVVQNAIMTAIATLRAAGAVAVLMWVDTSIAAYFIWQAVASAISLLALAIASYRTLPRAPDSTGFNLQALRPMAGYAAGMVGITLVSIGVTQIDKLILADRLPLADFGHYALATSVALVIGVIVGPVGAAYLPRFTQLLTQKDDAGLEQAFRMATQLAVLLAGVSAAMLIVFGDRLVLLWTQDAALSSEVGTLLPALAIGYGLQAVVSIPYLMQLSHGWTQLAIWLNVALIVLVVPLLLYVIPRYGALGATWVWAGVNIAYFAASSMIMFRRILPQLHIRWVTADVLTPLAIVGTVAAFLAYATPSTGGFAISLAIIIAAAAVLVIAAIAGSSLIRAELARMVNTRRAA